MQVLSNKWTLSGLLFLATTLNYLDRQTLAIVAPQAQSELGLNNEDLGWLFAVFYYSYTLAQFVVGGLLDRSHIRWAYGFGVLAWSGAAALTALTNGFASFLLFRTLLGVTESINWPAAMRIVARSLPPHERSLGNGIFTSGTSIGALVAPALILGIAARSNWRAAFIVVGSFGLLWFILWVVVTRNSAYDHVWKPEPQTGAFSNRIDAYRELLQASQFWRVFLIAILVNPCLYFLLNWLPTYFSQQWATTSVDLKWILTLIFLGLDLGYLFCGAAVLLLIRSGRRLRASRQAVFLVATGFLSMASLVPYAGSLNTAVALFFVANFGAGCWIAMYLTMAQEVSGKYVSTAAGLLGGSGSLAGAFAMWAVGKVTQQTSSFAIPLACVAVAAIAAAATGMRVIRDRTVS